MRSLLTRSVLIIGCFGLVLAACEDDGGVARDGSSVVDGRDAGASTDGDVGGTDSADGGGGGDGSDGGDGGLADALMVSALIREIIAAPTPAVATLTADNRRFATRLYKILRADAEAKNLFFSPHSISAALAMTFAGARGETAIQMTTALDFKLPAGDLHRAFNALDQELARRAQPLPGSTAELPKLTITNALWGRRDYRFLPAYLDLLSVNYGAGVLSLDFAGNTEGSRLIINRWVEDQTAGRIVDLLKPGAILPDTALVLTNAVYFKGPWGQPFSATGTADAPFTLLAIGGVVSVPTMTVQGSLLHAASADYQAVQLPYVGGKLAMLLIGPLAGRESAFETNLDAAYLDTVVAGLTAKEVRLFLPRFKFSADFKLKATLMAMGMPAAFGSQADFSGMNGTGGLAISDVVHQAFVAVDEKGTEAAAATGVIVGPPSGPPPAMDVRFDRPFLFLIRDVPTGAVLFFGRLADPRS